MNFTAQATPQSKLPPDIFRAPPHKLSGTVFPIGKVDVSAIRELLATKTEAEWQENAQASSYSSTVEVSHGPD